MIKLTFKPRDAKRKMTAEELQYHIQSKKQGNGAHKSKKDYSRKSKHRNIG
jgi:hypothetical protein